MKTKLKASFTVEAAVIVPIILMVFGTLLHILFYYHDKNIVMSVAHETLAVGCGREATSEEELEHYFASHIQGRLLLLTGVENDVQTEEEQMRIICRATKGPMTCKVEYVMKQTEPEDYIRSIRKIIKIQEGIGK